MPTFDDIEYFLVTKLYWRGWNIDVVDMGDSLQILFAVKRTKIGKVKIWWN